MYRLKQKRCDSSIHRMPSLWKCPATLQKLWTVYVALVMDAFELTNPSIMNMDMLSTSFFSKNRGAAFVNQALRKLYG